MKKALIDNTVVVANAVQFGTDVLRAMAGNQLDGNEMATIEEIFATELHAELMEKLNNAN